MPVEPLIDHPRGKTLPAAAYGMLVRMCHHYWETECEPLPVAEYEQRHIARAHAPTWRQWREDVLAILADVLPELERYYTWRINNRAHLIQTAANGRGVQKMQSMRTAARAADRAVAAMEGRTVAPRKRHKKEPAPLVGPAPVDSGGRKRRV